MKARQVFQDALAAESALGVLTHGPGSIAFPASPVHDRCEGVDVSRRERGDPALSVPFRHLGREEYIDRPGCAGQGVRAELLPRHVDDPLRLGQGGGRVGFCQVERYGLDAGLLEAVAYGRVGKAGDGVDTARKAGPVERALRHAGKGRSHFAARTDDREMTRPAGDGPYEKLRRGGELFVEGIVIGRCAAG
jgi:hypothetical protein